MINYVALMLINLVAGLFLLAYYVFRGMDSDNQREWAPGFAAVGIVGLVTGLHMIFNWPLPSSYNTAFGEMSVIFGTLFLTAALALGLNLGLRSVMVYAFFAGFAAILVGIQVINLKMTKQPALSGTGFIVTGLSGVLLPVAAYMKSNRAIRVAFVVVPLIALAIWAFTGYHAYWGHMESSAEWVPLLLRGGK